MSTAQALAAENRVPLPVKLPITYEKYLFLKYLVKFLGGAKGDWDFRVSDLVNSPDGTDV